MDIISKYITIILISVSTLIFEGCSTKDYYIDEQVAANLKSKKEYKIILIHNTFNNKFLFSLKKIFNEYGWKVIETKNNISDIEWNVQYEGLPKYTLTVKMEKIYKNGIDNYFFYNIIINDIKENHIIFEINDYGTIVDLENNLKKYLRRVF